MRSARRRKSDGLSPLQTATTSAAATANPTKSCTKALTCFKGEPRGCKNPSQTGTPELLLLDTSELEAILDQTGERKRSHSCAVLPRHSETANCRYGLDFGRLPVQAQRLQALYPGGVLLACLQASTFRAQ